MTDKAFYNEKLDRATGRCEEDVDYNYAACIEREIADTVGCQPAWGNITDLPHCQELRQYNRHANILLHQSLFSFTPISGTRTDCCMCC